MEKQRGSRKGNNLLRCHRFEETATLWRCRRCYSPPPKMSRKTEPPMPLKPKPSRRVDDGDEKLIAIRGRGET
ncbi:LOW QUALITY PROTEIN: hypothetical protein HID58_069582 [Brassica napus]|uniref:Uncharacterized protein n=1 Tax=Brassica napus TaxID=3708 RepID=A0ABQ7YWE4_BRANA|nr:LOW QUALITY PROTEIN: hypothetical protein HID58_069582 [Brassica napus]